MNDDPYRLGRDFSNGPQGPDRSLLAHCLGRLSDVFGDDWALEFGTASGETARMIAAELPVISFDSFQGLPEDWRPGFPKGKFGHHKVPTDIPNATFVQGWFEDTVPNYDWPENVSLIHLDADLYSSTRTVLMAIKHLIVPGVIIVFDEFHGYEDDLKGPVPGEQQAWREFAEDSPGLAWKVIGSGREQWAIEITSGAAA